MDAATAAPATRAAAGDEGALLAVDSPCGPSVVHITTLAHVFTWLPVTIPEQGRGSGFVSSDQGTPA